MDHLIDTHFPGTDRTAGAETTQIHTPNATDWDLARKIMTERIVWAINSFKPFKSPGKDGIYPVVLQKSSHIIVEPLKQIFRAVLALGYIPRAWRDVVVLFIPKPGRSTYDRAGSYRPISLTSFLLKTLERMCDRYVRDEILRVKPLHKNQHAYQAGKSTETALHHVVHMLERNMNYKKLTLAVFFDLEGGFNKVAFRTINKDLRRFNVDRTLIRWIMSMLRNRILSVNLFGVHRTELVDRGCPQGGVLPPLLWNMTVDDLLTKLNESGYLAIGYADDIAILISGAYEEVILSLMNSVFRILEKWCGETGLSVNPEKTGLVLFTNKKRTSLVNLPKIFGVELSMKTNFKYLGVILDNKLNWKDHIEEAKT